MHDAIKILDALGLAPATGVRAVFSPTFHPACVITLQGGVLDLHAPLGSLEAWPRPAISHERIEIEAGVPATLIAAAHEFTDPGSSGRDGMSVWLELPPRRYRLWFSADARTPPGQVVTALITLALGHCRWLSSCDRLRALLRYT